MGRLPRWSVIGLDLNWLAARALAVSWASIPEESGAEDYACRMAEILSDVCDCAMPRVRTTGGVTRSVYWWSSNIADLRARCVRARRSLYRRRNGASTGVLARLWASLRETRRDLRRAIGRAKRSAWHELLATLEADPWGRPYRSVLKCVRTLIAPDMRDLASQVFGRSGGHLFSA